MNSILAIANLITTGQMPPKPGQLDPAKIMMDQHRKKVADRNELALELDKECQELAPLMFPMFRWETMPDFARFKVWGKALMKHEFKEDEPVADSAKKEDA